LFKGLNAGKKTPSQVVIQKASMILHLCAEEIMCHLLHSGIKYSILCTK